MAELQGHTGAVIGVGGDREGHLLYSASFDGTVRLWDARTHGYVLVFWLVVHDNFQMIPAASHTNPASTNEISFLLFNLTCI